ncbi:hypothetical protein [Rhodococcus koreensis]|uniref:hypothetical protein n=1 Tax=Rhodococcus koreensis TaxID=99653 RepID=UPI0036DDE228
MRIDYSQLINMPLEQVYVEGESLDDEPTPVHDELERERRSVELQFPSDIRATFAAEELNRVIGDGYRVKVIDKEAMKPVVTVWQAGLTDPQVVSNEAELRAAVMRPRTESERAATVRLPRPSIWDRIEAIVGSALFWAIAFVIVIIVGVWAA